MSGPTTPWIAPSILGVSADDPAAAEAAAEAVRLYPDDAQIAIWVAIGMAGMGRLDDARRIRGA